MRENHFFFPELPREFSACFSFFPRLSFLFLVSSSFFPLPDALSIFITLDGSSEIEPLTFAVDPHFCAEKLIDFLFFFSRISEETPSLQHPKSLQRSKLQKRKMGCTQSKPQECPPAPRPKADPGSFPQNHPSAVNPLEPSESPVEAENSAASRTPRNSCSASMSLRSERFLVIPRNSVCLDGPLSPTFAPDRGQRTTGTPPMASSTFLSAGGDYPKESLAELPLPAAAEVPWSVELAFDEPADVQYPQQESCNQNSIAMERGKVPSVTTDSPLAQPITEFLPPRVEKPSNYSRANFHASPVPPRSLPSSDLSLIKG